MNKIILYYNVYIFLFNFIMLNRSIVKLVTSVIVVWYVPGSITIGGFEWWTELILI